MVTRQEKSDDLVVPEDRRKPVPTDPRDRGGKEVTASQAVEQLELFRGTAENPQGANGVEVGSRVSIEATEVPKPRTTTGPRSPAKGMMEAIANTALLRSAFAKIASNKGAAGPDRQTIGEVREHIDELLPDLSASLLDGSYRPGNIRRVWIPKPAGGRRGLGIPNVIDRIVQQAALMVLSPLLEPQFHEGSHGFRPGRSCHTAILAAKAHVEDGATWVVDIDLEKFFDRVHHERLLARLGHMGVDDIRVIRLVRRMLKAKVVMPDGIVVSTDEGTPQGGPLSPLLSNVVLDELDRELDRRGLRFVRYADDCNIYVGSRRAGERVMASVSRFIETRLRLSMNTSKSAVAKPTHRHFVGFRLATSMNGHVQIRLSSRSLKRIRRRCVELTPRVWGGSLHRCIERVNEYLRGWISFFGIVDRAALYELKRLDAHLRRRLRAIVLRQKKRRSHIFSFFRKRRVKKGWAIAALYKGSKRFWALSISFAANKAMSSYWFDHQGLVRLVKLWKRRQPKPELGSLVPSPQLEFELG